jgi:hypothetical protein
VLLSACPRRSPFPHLNPEKICPTAVFKRSGAEGISNGRAPMSGDPIERFHERLQSISPEPRDDWLAVGMALHHESGGSPAGFEMWCAWARRSRKFDEADSLRTWNGFKPGTRASQAAR